MSALLSTVLGTVLPWLVSFVTLALVLWRLRVQSREIDRKAAQRNEAQSEFTRSVVKRRSRGAFADAARILEAGE